MTRIALGIDAGGSSTGWLLLDETGETLGRGRLGGISGHLQLEDGSLSGEGEASLDRLGTLLEEVLLVARPSAVVMGGPGLESASPSAVLFEEAIRDRLGGDTAVVVENDMELAYRSSFAPGEGVIVYGGTGSIAYHVPRHGPPLRAGGHGYLIDDAGGGYWIGRRALEHVLRLHDELGQPAGTPLARAIHAQLGGSDWPTIRQAVYQGGRSRVAGLAPAVVMAANRGDKAAVRILNGAGIELARLAAVLLRRLGTLLPVTLMGGATRMGPHLRDALQGSLPGGIALTVNPDDPVLAAARLALELS